MAWSSAQKQSVMGQLVAGGVQPLGAAALVSRWSNVEDPNGSGSTVNSIGATGIEQVLGSRKTGLFAFADENGGSPYDVNIQTQYALSELHGPESGALAQLNGATNAYDAATGASMFERAEGYNSTTGTDNFTGATANGIPNIMSGWQGTSPDDVSYVSVNPITGDDASYDASLTSNMPGDGSDPTNTDLTGSFGLNQENIDAANYAGASSGLYSQTGAKLQSGSVSTASAGYNLVDAVNKQTQQLSTNQQAADVTATNVAKTQSATSTGIIASLEEYGSNLFVRGALITVGVLFILAAVLALAFGGGNLKEGFRAMGRTAEAA